MLDIKKLKEDPARYEAMLKSKDPEADLKKVLTLYDDYLKVKQTFEEKQSSLNAASKAIGEKKRAGGDASEEIAKLASLKQEIGQLDVKSLEEAYLDAAARLPNLPMDHIKVSHNPDENVCIKTVGEKRAFSFKPKNHLELGESLGLFDFKRGAKVTGSGWPIYTGMGARLEWALINLMLDTHIKNGFEFILPPHLASRKTLYGCGQLPKFEDQAFKITDDDYDLFLIPTSEAILGGLHSGEILPEESLPIKYTSYTPCFRREAGAHGAGERGLIRVHQFNKVELFAYTTPEQTEAMMEAMLASAEEVLNKLELPYRNMELVTGDMSFAAARTIDIEVFLPGQDRYYEVSSVSNCTDYQARRSATRYKGSGKPAPLHTLNGSGLATSRLMVALLETNQTESGTIDLPAALAPYLGTTTLA